MGSSSIESAGEQLSFVMPETPCALPGKKVSEEAFAPNVCLIPESSVGDVVRKVFIEQPITMEKISDLGSRAYEIATQKYPEGSCEQMAQKTAKEATLTGIFSLAAYPARHALTALKALDVHRFAETCKLIFTVARAEKDQRASVALKETSALILTGATVALATTCAPLLIPAAIVKTFAASMIINFTAGAAMRGAIKKGEVLLGAPAA